MHKYLVIFVLALVPQLLLAHGSHGDGIMAGFTHPIFGYDHAVAILGIGILSFVHFRSKWYLYFLSFLVAMILGGMLGIGNEATPFIENIILFSVFAVGFLLVLDVKIPAALIAFLLGLFGAVHGYAHGAEMSVNNTALKYISGYALGTMLLGITGMLIGKLISTQEQSNRIRKFCGGVLIGAGLYLAFF